MFLRDLDLCRTRFSQNFIWLKRSLIFTSVQYYKVSIYFWHRKTFSGGQDHPWDLSSSLDRKIFQGQHIFRNLNFSFFSRLLIHRFSLLQSDRVTHNKEKIDLLISSIDVPRESTQKSSNETSMSHFLWVICSYESQHLTHA